MQIEQLSSATMKRPSGWKLAMNIALPILLIAVFAWQIHKSWPAITGTPWTIHWGPSALALVLLLVNSCVEIFIWNRTLRWFTEPLSFRLAVPVYIWSSLARYIPGKVASLIVRVGLATEVKRDIVPVLASSTVELALRTASGLLLFLLALVVSGNTNERSLLVGPLVIIPLVLICAHPRIMLPAMNWALKQVKQAPITHVLSYGEVLGIFLATVVRWVIYGLAFALLAWAIHPAAIKHVPVLVGTASGSWAAGFIGMSPGGAGIAEWIQNIVLEGALKFPERVALLLPIFFRLTTLLAEGLWALVAIPLWRKR